MVGSAALNAAMVPTLPDSAEVPEEEFRWCSVGLAEVMEKGCLLKAAVFDVEGRHAREVITRCKWPLTRVGGNEGLADAFYLPRFKRTWVEKSDLPIYQPGQITELDPRPAAYLSPHTKTDIDSLRVSSGQILMTRSGRSGSIGRTTYVSDTINGRIFSDDLIRIRCRADADRGYLYAFLRTKVGRALVKTNEYGAMIPHIEPSHLSDLPIPDPPPILKRRIHDLVMRSYALRDESNVMMNKAQQLLRGALKLPALETLAPRYFDGNVQLRNYRVNLSRLDGRLDASYHVPLVDSIVERLASSAAEMTNVGDPRVSDRIVLPGRFKRVYVQEGQGRVFFGGKQLYELDPSKKKYLSLSHHGDRIREQLTLEENMVLISCSGTIGKTVLVPKHWEGWTANQHVMRVVPASTDIAGYLYVFLASDYGRELIRHFTYGAVVEEIDSRHVAEIPFPLLSDASVQDEIGRLALTANAKRAEAYRLEQQAVHVTNEEVIHAEV